jgi:hypothetical protein
VLPGGPPLTDTEHTNPDRKAPREYQAHRSTVRIHPATAATPTASDLLAHANAGARCRHRGVTNINCQGWGGLQPPAESVADADGAERGQLSYQRGRRGRRLACRREPVWG